MLYLLHFEPKVSTYSHYVGACLEHRLKDRLIEHARGRGSQLTKRAVKARATIYVARVFPELGFVDEQRVKRASHFKDLCPLCCPLLANLKDKVYALDLDRPEQPPERAIWDWRPRPPTTGT